MARNKSLYKILKQFIFKKCGNICFAVKPHTFIVLDIL